ncbi:GTPase HflX [Candidatus Roizmanbacteria bacterium]|nr:GTPase HflX [Candidatus Roizmanbacteria bacterium]
MQNAKRFILVRVIDPHVRHADAAEDMDELHSLVTTYGGADIVRVIQHRNSPHPKTFIGTGKALELSEMVKRERIDVVVLDALVNPMQIFNLQKLFWSTRPETEVWDRVGLILNIFYKHAVSAEAKLQIELARMKHMGPRIYGLGETYFSRQGGGIGTRGLGETNIELMKRHWRIQIKKVADQLEKYEQGREQRLKRRQELGLQTVSLVGYTNAGKTTLFNRLANKRKLASDILFATLDSSVGQMYLAPIKKEVLISDTIGFIQNLPPALIQAFKSTLTESIHSRLLLHVIDSSDPKIREKIIAVENILHDLQIEFKDHLYVFNKVDRPSPISQQTLLIDYGRHRPQFISAEKGIGIDDLKKTIATYFGTV